MRARSRLTTGRDRSRHSTPPTTEVPPPNGTTKQSAAQSSRSATSASSRREGHHVGSRATGRRASARMTSRYAFPYVWAARASGRLSTVEPASRMAVMRGAARLGDRRDRGQLAVEGDQRTDPFGQFGGTRHRRAPGRPGPSPTRTASSRQLGTPPAQRYLTGTVPEAPAVTVVADHARLSCDVGRRPGHWRRRTPPGRAGVASASKVTAAPTVHCGGSGSPLSAQAACRAAPSATYSPGGGTSTGHAEDRRRDPADRLGPGAAADQDHPVDRGALGRRARRGRRRGRTACPRRRPGPGGPGSTLAQAQAVHRAGGVRPVRGPLALQVGHQDQPVGAGRRATGPARRARRGRRRAGPAAASSTRAALSVRPAAGTGRSRRRTRPPCRSGRPPAASATLNTVPEVPIETTTSPGPAPDAERGGGVVAGARPPSGAPVAVDRPTVGRAEHRRDGQRRGRTPGPAGRAGSAGRPGTSSRCRWRRRGRYVSVVEVGTAPASRQVSQSCGRADRGGPGGRGRLVPASQRSLVTVKRPPARCRPRPRPTPLGRRARRSGRPRLRRAGVVPQQGRPDDPPPARPGRPCRAAGRRPRAAATSSSPPASATAALSARPPGLRVDLGAVRVRARGPAAPARRSRRRGSPPCTTGSTSRPRRRASSVGQLSAAPSRCSTASWLSADEAEAAGGGRVDVEAPRTRDRSASRSA